MSECSFYIGDKVTFIGAIKNDESLFYSDGMVQPEVSGFVTGTDPLYHNRVIVTWSTHQKHSCHFRNLKLVHFCPNSLTTTQ